MTAFSPIAGLDARTPRIGLLRFDRPKRVMLLLVATGFMSLADLVMTLTYATSVGMMEVNPIARAVMAGGSPWMLSLWKFATAGLGLGILFALRRVRKAEAASWMVCAVMTALTLHWMSFNHAVAHCADEYAALADGTDNPHWVVMARR
ncbi:MAG: hypothetical protein JNK25_07515 [Phycisphaerae bacterium]|nr:hypothetical protein [Phycisphaerae bacterium]